MERSESGENNCVVRTVEGNPVKRSKSQESNPVVHTVSYAYILGIIIPLSFSIDTHNLKISRLPTCYLCAPEPLFLPVLSL